MQINYKTVGFAFALISLVAIVWQHFGMTRVLRIDKDWPHGFNAIDDSGMGGGTRSSLTVTEEGVLLTCDLSLDYQWPYCEIAVPLSADGTTPVDLSIYEELKISLAYRDPGVDRVRVMARNFNPGYSTPGDFDTYKVNEIDYRPSSHPVLQLPLQAFQVASWWRHAMSLPVDYIGPEFSGVVQFDVSTGGQVVAGRYEILLHYLELRGKWISAVTLYRALLVAWLTLALLAALWELKQHRQRLRESQQRETELRALNHLLELQSEKFEKMASHDTLTGVRNRAGIRDPFLEHIRDARYRGRPLAAVFIDIDHFKQINDTHGHQVGDQILVDFARLVAANIREKDLFARWGGEEFLLLCPGTPVDAAIRLAEELRKLIEAHHWPRGAHVSASFGVTEFCGEKGEEVGMFISRADRALYEAKAAGRNRVVARRLDTDTAA